MNKKVDNKEKTSKLVFDPKVSRRLLKMNGHVKFCPFCGVAIADGCECHKNIVVDLKPMRGSEDASVFVFINNESFKKDFDVLMEEMKSKKDDEPEQLTIDFCD